MARITVEDCILKIPNRFELVLMASQRAKNIAIGSPLTVERDNDKNSVIALREIAEDTINVDDLQKNLVYSLQKIKRVNEPVAEEKEIAEALQELSLDANAEYAFVKENETDIKTTGSFEISDKEE